MLTAVLYSKRFLNAEKFLKLKNVYYSDFTKNLKTRRFC